MKEVRLLFGESACAPMNYVFFLSFNSVKYVGWTFLEMQEPIQLVQKDGHVLTQLSQSYRCGLTSYFLFPRKVVCFCMCPSSVVRLKIVKTRSLFRN